MKKIIFLTVLTAFLIVNSQYAKAGEYDLTGSINDKIKINDAWFYNVNAASTGSGVIQSFVRIQTNDPTEEGYNTGYRPLEFDENNSPTFTRNLSLSLVPTIDLYGNGTLYREFLLDINQSNNIDNKTGANNALLSLDKLEIYLGNAGDLHGYSGGLGTLIYNLDTGEDNWIVLDYNLNTGSGSGDMFAYIPDSLFTGGNYVYLYSMFGAHNPNTSGFEEWAVRTSFSAPPPPPVTPVPGAVLLGLLGLSIAGLKLRKYA